MQREPFTQAILSSPDFKDIFVKHDSESLVAFLELQETRAIQASLIERIARDEETQRSQEALTRRMDRFIFWPLSLAASSTTPINIVLK